MSVANLLRDEVADTRYAGNTEFSKTITIEQESRAVVDQFFKSLSLIIGSKPVLFLVDADRQSIYKGTNDNSFFSKMRKYFINRACDHEVVDMYPIFLDHYRIHKAKFEFPTDGHWNELGHRLAADAVLRSKTVQKLMQ